MTRSSQLEVGGLQAWRMSLPAEKSFVAPTPRVAPVHNKTLVAWAAPATLDQAGGGVLTLEGPNDLFDGIVFGEAAPRRWMAGSDFFRRTCPRQDAWPQEIADARTLVQIAVTYRGRRVTIYRNGVLYAEYTMQGDPAAFGPDDTVYMGRRHLRAAGAACFSGEIEDARIYDRALTAEQIVLLRPNLPSDPNPWAWWTFEDGRAEDLMHTFPISEIMGKARIERGRLLLDGQESYAVFRRSATSPPAPPKQ